MYDNVAIVIPALNEAATIEAVASDALLVCGKVFVVDDGSTDHTGMLAAKCGAEVLRNPTPKGLGAALRRGFEHARACGLEYIVTLDADGAHDPLQAPGLIDCHIERQASLTIGSRFGRDGPHSPLPSAKIDANFFARFVVNKILDTNLTDVASGMRVLTAAFAASSLRMSNFAIAFELIRRAAEDNLVIAEHAISVRYDAGELFATSTTELLDFLGYWGPLAPDTMQKGLEEISMSVASGALVAVRCGPQLYVVHPLDDGQRCAFQQQNTWYDRRIPAKYVINI
jgi:glycosyltransferase involved in cell wall biosynthesis